MTTIELFADDQNLRAIESPKLASGDKNSVKIHVEFNSEWDGYIKTGVFFVDKKAVFEQLIENDECIIPHEVLENSAILYIGLRGVNTNTTQVKTSALIEYRIVDGAPQGTAESVPPTDTVYEQLLKAYDNALKAIKKYKTDLSNENEQFKKDVNTNIDNKFKTYQKSMNDKYNQFTSSINQKISDITSQNNTFQQTINNSFNDYKTEVNTKLTDFKSDVNQMISDFKSDVNLRIRSITYILSQETEPEADEQIEGDFWYKTTTL